jgi:2,4-dienoyl-CoA reductase-like NADH-dependent reductase (Old Yellow Enzyme family)
MELPLFKPFALRHFKLKNRLVMAPMTRGFAPHGIPTEQMATYYQRRAKGHVGLIITEGTVVDRPSSTVYPDVPHFYGEKALEGWEKVVTAVKAEGSKIAPQIWHQGIVKGRSDWDPPALPEGPSGIISSTEKGGKTMDLSDIEATQKAFIDAAIEAKRLGFDCIELHGAHGYLIDQFFWHVTNQRNDRYGGISIENRIRFVAEIIRDIRIKVGPEFPIILRLSQWKQQDYSAKIASTPEELEQWITPLSDAGVDIFHCSQRRIAEPEFSGSSLNFAGWVKKITGKPTISVGSVGLNGDFLKAFRGEGAQVADIEWVNAALDREEFDLVAVGRALIADPDWAIKIRDNRTHELVGFRKEHLATLY